jgi:hypothetical protein
LDNTNVIPILEDLISRTEKLPHGFDQSHLLGILYQNLGNRRWYDISPPENIEPDEVQAWKNQHWATQVMPIYETAIQHKTDCNDVQGLAIAYGSRANVQLFTLGDLDAAEKDLKKDLNVLEENGMVADISSIMNRLSILEHKRSLNSSDEVESAKHLTSACELAKTAFEMAVKLEREADVGFAGHQYLSMLMAQKELDVSAFNKVGNILAAPVLWAEIRNGYLKGVTLKLAEQITQTQTPAPNWSHELVAILTEWNQQTGNSG